MHKQFAEVEISGEYARFLAEKALSEDAVLPVLKDRTMFSDPAFLAHVALVIASLPKANKDELDKAQGFLDGIEPGRNTNWLLRYLNQQLLADLQVAGISLPSGILDVGVFPLETFNARIVSRPSGFLVLVDTGAVEILELCAGLGVLERATYEERGNELRACVVAYCESRKLPPKSPYVEAEWKERNQLICIATNWADRFVLGHEYGHHVLGHLRTSRLEMCEAAASQFDVNVFEHVHEYEADIWALWALLRSARANAPANGNVLGLACASPFYFLATLALIEGIWRTKGFEPKSHPPAVNRILNLERCLHVWGLLNEDCFLWTHFGRIADIASLSLFGQKLIPRPDKHLRRDLTLISNRLLSELKW